MIDDSNISPSARDYFHVFLETNDISPSRDANGIYVERFARNLWSSFCHGYFAGFTDCAMGPVETEVH